MGCLLIILAVAAPRVTLAALWLLTDWGYETFGEVWLYPLLGLAFMPYTTLAYMGAVVNEGAVAGIWLPIVIIAVLVDLAHIGGGVFRRSKD